MTAYDYFKDPMPGSPGVPLPKNGDFKITVSNSVIQSHERRKGTWIPGPYWYLVTTKCPVERKIK